MALRGQHVEGPSTLWTPFLRWWNRRPRRGGGHERIACARVDDIVPAAGPATGRHRALAGILRERILVLDGAMGTMIQGYQPGEKDFRGERFADWDRDVKGNSDLLNLTQPDIIRSIHRQYLEAGADIVETNTFTATSIAQADYGMEDLAYEINLAGARLARAACDEVAHRRTARGSSPGSLGPDQPHRLDLARRQRPRGPQRHLRGARRGVPRAGPRPRRRRRRPAAGRDDLRHPQRQGRDLRPRDPLRGARPPLAGDHLRHHHRRVRPHPVRPGDRGVLELRAPRPAARGRPQLRAGRRRDAPLRRRALPARRHASSPCYPNAGLPNAFGEYDETPDQMSATRRRVRRQRPGQPRRRLLRHHPGAHRGDRRRRRRACTPRAPAEPAPAMRLSGLEPLNITEDSLFVNVGERTNITGSARFRNLIKAGDYDTALSVAGAAGRERRAGHRRQHGRGHDRRRRRDGPLPQADRQRARHQPGPGDGRLLQVGGHRGRPALRPGQADRQLDLHEGGRGEVPRAGHAVPQVRRRRGRDGLRRGRPGRQPRAPQGDLRARLPDPHRARSASRPRTSSSTPTSSPSRPASRSTRRTAWTSSRPPAGSRRTCPARWSPAASPTSSFSFRGNNPVREAIHAVFLFHAIQAGLDMGIVNAGALVGLRRGRARAARADRGRRPQPPPGRRRAAPRDRRGAQRGAGRGRGGDRSRSGARCPSASGSPTPWSRASTPTSRTTPRSSAPRSPSAAAARSRSSRAR